MASGIARLCDAVRGGNVNEAQTLLDEGMLQVINERDETGSAPLHLAAKQESLKLVELFLEYGADLDVKDHSQSTPLNYAAQGKNDIIARLLLDNWADISNQDDSGSTPLHNAVRDGNIAMVKLFMKFDADVNAEDNSGDTPIHLAAELNNSAIGNILLGQDIPLDAATVAPKPVFPIVINGNLLDESIPPAADASTTDYILVQTKARLDPSERENLTRANLHILEYVSPNTYLCGYRVGELARIRQLEPVVYVDLYRRDLKVAPDLQEVSNSVQVDVIFHEDVNSNSQQLRALIIEKSGPGLTDIEFCHHKARLSTAATQIEELAKIDQVRNIERVGVRKLYNENARQILACSVQHTPSSAVSCTYQGEGQVITVADTGLDTGDLKNIHVAFGNRVVDIVGLNGWGKDVVGHGTHVCGSAVGDGMMNKQSIKGTAPQAELVMQSIWHQPDNSLRPPTDLAQLFDPAYTKYNSRVHSNSWGGGSANMDYNSDAKEIDKFVWGHPEMVICFAAGNDADYDKKGNAKYGQIGGLGAAKNSITVGATESERSDPIVKYRDLGFRFPYTINKRHIAEDRSRVAAFSNRGAHNLIDGTRARAKPDLVAPGTHVLSAKSSAQKNPLPWYSDSGDAAWCYKSGTSMATPLVAGCAAVLREVLAHHGLANPSAALIKALLINGAEKIPPPFSSPGLDSGFGRVNLTNSIAAASNQAETGRCENQLSNGKRQFAETIRVESNHTSIKATLVWSDPPGKILQNILKLQIVDPDGSPPRGISTNNVQQIVHKWSNRPPREIRLEVKVIGSLHISPQPFAVVWNKSQ